MEKKESQTRCNIGPLPEPKSINIGNLIKDMWPLYQDTIKSHLDELEGAAMALEAGRDIDENISLIRRVLHSIKGSSGVIGLTDVSDVCHRTETAFEKVTDTTASVDMILKVKDWVEAVIEYIAESNISTEQQQQHADSVEGKPKLKALIIDDDPVCRQGIGSLLGDFFDCSVAVDGREGLEAYIESRAQNNPFDFITLDINMPKLNGHETLAAIRKWESENGLDGDNVKIIMTTSEGASKHIFSSFKQGCEAYVLKSNLSEKMLEEVAKLGLLKIAKVQTSYTVS